jgi:DNA-binding beta-propeller fold protein YncE
MRISIPLIAVLVLFFTGSSSAQSLPTEISGFQHPESVYQRGQTLYVSNIGTGMDPSKKNNDGFISKVDLTHRQVTELHFLGGGVTGTLYGPKGMALKGSVLYVADVDRIVGFDVDTRKKVMELSIAGTSFLNDLVMGDGLLYASATDNGKIYVIDVDKKTYHPLALPDSIVGANGLAYDGASSTLYCVGVGVWGHNDGQVYAIDLQHSQGRVLCGYRGLLDGVEKKGNTLYFSDWKSPQGKGGLLALDLTSRTVAPVTLAYGPIAGPADFSLSADGRIFIIPATMEGKILFEPVEK